ncbi:hypothetical protein B0H16DRAFT_1478984 [Mycena metata]|uniref:Uncharacterized protein n=1 Tax=Mycena metata TaxID=1033252 RepID=A0AAD7H6C2_9AGAR|nr:hypothetical protein B0H16DRAFT_1478984 [Mycena metata]
MSANEVSPAVDSVQRRVSAAVARPRRPLTKRPLRRISHRMNFKYPNLVRNIQLMALSFPLTHVQKRKLESSSGQAELVTAICICIEQTFTQASAHQESFGPAFSTALDAYLASTIKDAVNSAITALPAQDFEQVDREYSWKPVKKVAPKLVYIIKNHRLRKKACSTV